ncbi:PaaI family thioesterase [Halioxenophilus sp. WMMB6]|uniref:PaaI family thioesterase n=1 Tax=Halioxenophilus sp. WMMB6 TaxID=3073815 RepID=UPI00295F3987|nr:PaaI family thioesterase [Halioxenophilus sp. WMMB6]
MAKEIPAGYEPIDFDIPFFQLIGPVYHKVGAEVLHLGMLIEKQHCNSLATVHGGLLATLADVAAVRALVQHLGDDKRAFTISLHLDYIGTAYEGDWLEAHVQIKKGQGSVGFATCEIKEGERLIMMASGSFKFITPRATD